MVNGTRQNRAIQYKKWWYKMCVSACLNTSFI